MSMNLSLRAESGSLYVTATGYFSLELARTQFQEILEAAARHNTAKILVDGRELKGKPRDIERFIYGKSSAVAVARYVQRGAIPQSAVRLCSPRTSG